MQKEQTYKTALIIEDEQTICALIGSILEEELPVRAYFAFSGAQAIELIGRLTPDLMILDYQLPDMHGLQLYDLLHAPGTTTNIPTLVVSANPPVQELERRHLPYLQKPFDLDELISLAQQLLNRENLPAGPALAPPAPTQPPTSTHTPANPSLCTHSSHLPTLPQEAMKPAASCQSEPEAKRVRTC